MWRWANGWTIATRQAVYADPQGHSEAFVGTSVSAATAGTCLSRRAASCFRFNALSDQISDMLTMTVSASLCRRYWPPGRQCMPIRRDTVRLSSGRACQQRQRARCLSPEGEFAQELERKSACEEQKTQHVLRTVYMPSGESARRISCGRHTCLLAILNHTKEEEPPRSSEDSPSYLYFI